MSAYSARLKDRLIRSPAQDHVGCPRIGFLMRPLGAIVLGTYTDRHGRRAGLLLTVGFYGRFSPVPWLDVAIA
jgi:hypothetical protein